MRRTYKYYILVISVLFCSCLQGQSKKFRIDKEPAWVTIDSIDFNNAKFDHEGQDGYIDINYEKQVHLQQQSVYYIRAYKIISEAGVQNSSEISIAFDPSYEQLFIHTIKIRRGEKSINKLQPEKIKTIQQESELDRHIYDQSLSAILFLEDVRKGDIIEYSYTLKGFNSIFKGRYADVFEAAFSVPICNLNYKIIVPRGRAIYVKNQLTSIQPDIKNSNSEIVYQWKQVNVPALRAQDNLPSWYDPYPAIMISEYKSWKEVNDWAMELFPEIKKVPVGLQRKINEICLKDTNLEKRTLAALRFVQDEVRYMGFEMGERSHKPFSPGKVLAQRFGDCKDKSYLLCTMLQAMDIEANPVLINSSYKSAITNRLPSPTAFDHVTVQVRLNNTSFFFDPTISYQRGDIKEIAYPDYQTGLLISANTNELIKIPTRGKGMVKVKEIFHIPDMSGKAQLKVTTQYTGSFADDIRISFNNNSSYEMLKKFRDYYAAFFENIKGDSISFTDNDSSGIFSTREYYTISDIWDIEGGKKKVQFQPFVINGVLQKPKDINRQMPFSIRFPESYKEEIEINLPEEWNASKYSDEVRCNNFFMKMNFSYFNKKILLKYEYKSFKDHVSPEETPQFLKSFDRINKSIAYDLTWRATNKETEVNLSDIFKPQNYIYVILSILTIVIIGWIIWRIVRS